MSVISNAKKGFTLVELLIVIAILAVLSAAVVIVLNPAELLAQARDSQRLNDMDTLRNAISIYLSQVSSPSLGTACQASATKGCCNVTGCTSPFTGNGVVVEDTGTGVDGTGWVSVNLAALTGGSPIPRLPIDPTNTSTYYYSYINSGLYFEIDCKLESTKFSGNLTADGGNSATFYEVGNDAGLDL